MGSLKAKLIVLAIALSGIAGCADSTPPANVVTGVVYYADNASAIKAPDGRLPAELVGKPIVGAKVTFHDRGSPIGYGITDTLGRFRIRCYPTKSAPVDGLPQGSYTVTITKLSLVEKASPTDSGGANAEVDHPLPIRYGNPRTTEWQDIQVKLGGGGNHFRLAVRE